MKQTPSLKSKTLPSPPWIVSHDLEVAHLHIARFSEVEEVVQLELGVVP